MSSEQRQNYIQLSKYYTRECTCSPDRLQGNDVINPAVCLITVGVTVVGILFVSLTVEQHPDLERDGKNEMKSEKLISEKIHKRKSKCKKPPK